MEEILSALQKYSAEPTDAVLTDGWRRTPRTWLRFTDSVWKPCSLFKPRCAYPNCL